MDTVAGDQTQNGEILEGCAETLGWLACSCELILAFRLDLLRPSASDIAAESAMNRSLTPVGDVILLQRWSDACVIERKSLISEAACAMPTVSANKVPVTRPGVSWLRHRRRRQLVLSWRKSAKSSLLTIAEE